MPAGMGAGAMDQHTDADNIIIPPSLVERAQALRGVSLRYMQFRIVRSQPGRDKQLANAQPSSRTYLPCLPQAHAMGEPDRPVRRTRGNARLSLQELRANSRRRD